MTNLNAETYNFLMAVMGAYYQAMGKVRAGLPEQPPPLPNLLTVRSGYAESPAWYMMQAAEFAPDPLTVKNLRVRDIYASQKLVAALLEMLASEKWLDRRGDQYHLTIAGEQRIEILQKRSLSLLVELRPQLDEDIARLETLTRRLIDASLASPTPPGAWCLTHSRNRAPADDSPPLIKIFHYLSDFNAFRDDAHMAAFMPKEPKGYIWEAFTFVANQSADSAPSLFEQLAYRGYAQEDFQHALDHLANKGWIGQMESGESYKVALAGIDVQTGVEMLTDNYFYAPWKKLSAAELDEFLDRLQQLKEALEVVDQ